MDYSCYRVLDANLNRYREALRVMEDVCRFVRSDGEMSSQYKSMRHALQTASRELVANLIAARNVDNDPGTTISTPLEYKREGVERVFEANMKRAQEAARVLEEMGKMVSVVFATLIEKQRYRLYELEQCFWAYKSIPSPNLYVLITHSLCKHEPERVLHEVCAGGASMVQLREKDMEDGSFLVWIEKAKGIADSYGVPLIVNDRVHLARVTGIAGVHLGQGDLPTDRAREILLPHQIIGRSTHALSEALQAKEESVDYIGVGPLYPTNTKEHTRAVGLSYLEQVQQEAGIPYVAIGSVNRESIDDIMGKKPTGLAICTAIIGKSDPRKETEFYLKAING